MDPMFYAAFSVMAARPAAYLPGNTEEAETNDAALGEHWGGTEAVFDVPVDYGTEAICRW